MKKVESAADTGRQVGIYRKVKATSAPVSCLRIGTYQVESRFEPHLVGKWYYAKRKLVWEILENGLKVKIEISWSNVSAIRMVTLPNQPGLLQIELNKRPQLFREVEFRAGKHTTWKSTSDFTGGQVQIHRIHHLTFPPGSLDRNMETLFYCDSHLARLGKMPFPSVETTFCLCGNPRCCRNISSDAACHNNEPPPSQLPLHMIQAFYHVNSSPKQLPLQHSHPHSHALGPYSSSSSVRLYGAAKGPQFGGPMETQIEVPQSHSAYILRINPGYSHASSIVTTASLPTFPIAHIAKSSFLTNLDSNSPSSLVWQNGATIGPQFGGPVETQIEVPQSHSSYASRINTSYSHASDFDSPSSLVRQNGATISPQFGGPMENQIKVPQSHNSYTSRINTSYSHTSDFDSPSTLVNQNGAIIGLQFGGPMETQIEMPQSHSAYTSRINTGYSHEADDRNLRNLEMMTLDLPDMNGLAYAYPGNETIFASGTAYPEPDLCGVRMDMPPSTETHATSNGIGHGHEGSTFEDQQVANNNAAITNNWPYVNAQGMIELGKRSSSYQGTCDPERRLSH